MNNYFLSPQERLDLQIAELQKARQNMNQQPTNLTQNFSMMPQVPLMRFSNSLDDVKKEMVLGDTPFFSKDMSVLWIKNVRGEIKSYELNEIVPKDNKDLQIEYLQAQIEELRKEVKKNESNVNVVESTTKPIEDEESSSISTISKPKTKSRQSARDVE